MRGGLNEISSNNDDIIEAIDEISATSAAGPDGYSAMFLKKYRMTIAKPLYMIWRSCLDHGVTPNIWILSYVVPIFKGGSKGDPVNYRPVSLTLANYESGGTFFIGFIIEYLAKLNAIILIIYSRRPFNVVCELRVFALKGL